MEEALRTIEDAARAAEAADPQLGFAQQGGGTEEHGKQQETVTLGGASQGEGSQREGSPGDARGEGQGSGLSGFSPRGAGKNRKSRSEGESEDEDENKRPVNRRPGPSATRLLFGDLAGSEEEGYSEEDRDVGADEETTVGEGANVGSERGSQRGSGALQRELRKEKDFMVMSLGLEMGLGIGSEIGLGIGMGSGMLDLREFDEELAVMSVMQALNETNEAGEHESRGQGGEVHEGLGRGGEVHDSMGQGTDLDTALSLDVDMPEDMDMDMGMALDLVDLDSMAETKEGLEGTCGPREGGALVVRESSGGEGDSEGGGDRALGGRRGSGAGRGGQDRVRGGEGCAGSAMAEMAELLLASETGGAALNVEAAERMLKAQFRGFFLDLPADTYEKKQKHKLPPSATVVLNQWWMQHKASPYPTVSSVVYSPYSSTLM